MASTTNFSDWLSEAEPFDQSDAIDMYYAATEGGRHGCYEGRAFDDKVVLSHDGAQRDLFIASPLALQTFSQMVERDYFYDMTVDQLLYYNYQMAKGD